ncbi:MAG: hypothetical protein R3E79_51940 [Caldilineaceae bacterium]
MCISWRLLPASSCTWRNSDWLTNVVKSAGGAPVAAAAASYQPP